MAKSARKIEASPLNAAMARYRRAGPMEAARLLTDQGYEAPAVARAIAARAQSDRSIARPPLPISVLRWRDLERLIFRRHGGPVDTDDGPAYLPVLASALRGRVKAPADAIAAIKWLLPLVPVPEISAALDDAEGVTFSAQQAGNAVALSAREREELGITTMRPAGLSPQAWGKYRKRRRADQKAVTRAASRPLRLTYPTGALAQQLGVDRKTVQRAVAAGTLGALIDRHLDQQCRSSVPTGPLISVATKVRHPPFGPARFVDPVRYRRIVRPWLKALPRLLAELGQIATTAPDVTTLGDLERLAGGHKPAVPATQGADASTPSIPKISPRTDAPERAANSKGH